MLSQAFAVGALALATVSWPRRVPVIRLERATAPPEGAGDSGTATFWRLPGPPRTRWLRVVLAGSAIIALGQFWPVGVSISVVVVGAVLGRALVRGRRERAAVREEQAAVEALGILVAELRAGRTPEQAVSTASRHCAVPRVGRLLSRLGRSLVLGDRLDDPLDPDPMIWQRRLLAGVRLSRRTGCALAEVIAAVESDLVGRARQRAELRASAAGHRATVALLAGLPILGLAMGSGIGAEPVRILTSTGFGQVILMGGVGLELAGLAWSRRLTLRALREV